MNERLNDEDDEELIDDIEQYVQIRPSLAHQNEAICRVTCPDKTGLGADLARTIFRFRFSRRERRLCDGWTVGVCVVDDIRAADRRTSYNDRQNHQGEEKVRITRQRRQRIRAMRVARMRATAMTIPRRGTTRLPLVIEAISGRRTTAKKARTPEEGMKKKKMKKKTKKVMTMKRKKKKKKRRKKR